jgi:hypothetical protein
MRNSQVIRRGHRVVAGSFLVTVAAYLVLFAVSEPPGWVAYVPLAPLALAVVSGSYLLVVAHLGSKADVPAAPTAR